MHRQFVPRKKDIKLNSLSAMLFATVVPKKIEVVTNMKFMAHSTMMYDPKI
jgi:hypothetical protein